MLGLPPAITVIKDLDDAAAVAASRPGIPAPVITRTAATPQDSPKDVHFEQMNNTERSSSLQLPYGCPVILILMYSFLDTETGLQAPPTLFLFLLVLLLSDLRSAKAFQFHNRSLPNFAYTYATTFSTIAP